MFTRTVQSGGSGSFQFSTTEQKTGLKWVDGKDIYCRVLEGTTPSASDMPLEQSQQPQNMDLLINIEGYVIDVGDNKQQVGHYFGDAYYNSFYQKTNEIYFHGSNTTVKPYKIIAYYTKTN